MAKTHIDVSEHLDDLLDSAEQLFLESGHAGVSLEAVAQRSSLGVREIQKLYPHPMDILVAMLNREFSAMYRGIVEDVERDPLGGLLSRIYRYTLPQVYQRPTARALYLTDPDSLRVITSHQHAQMYRPTVEIRQELIGELVAVGMIRPGADPQLVSQVLGVISGGLALTAPHDNLSEIVEEMLSMFGQKFDADVIDTTPGKKAFYQWATSLELNLRDNAFN